MQTLAEWVLLQELSQLLNRPKLHLRGDVCPFSIYTFLTFCRAVAEAIPKPLQTAFQSLVHASSTCNAIHPDGNGFCERKIEGLK